MSNLKEIITEEHRKGQGFKILQEVNKSVNGRICHNFTSILYDIRTLLGPDKKTYLEIGSYAGASAALILRNPYPTEVICIDPCDLDQFGGKHALTLNNNLEKNNIHNNLFKVYENYSTDNTLISLLQQNNTKVDLLFIDGDHTEQGVLTDWKLYEQFLNPGGFVVFDDYNDDHYSPGVRPAVNSIIKTLSDDYTIIGDIDNVLDIKCPVAYNHPTLSNEFIIHKN